MEATGGNPVLHFLMWPFVWKLRTSLHWSELVSQFYGMAQEKIAEYADDLFVKNVDTIEIFKEFISTRYIRNLL